MIRRVLILCTGNSCRSQMAEGLWNELGGPEWKAVSAGSKPSGYVHPLAVRAMRDRELDISAGRSKSAEEFAGQDFDLVVTVCDNARETCPVFPGAKLTLHWPFDDPAEATGTDEQRFPIFVKIRDEIESRIRDWLADTNSQL